MDKRSAVVRGDDRDQVVELAQFKEDRAPYTLEVHYFVKPPRHVNLVLRTLLWVSGPTQMPDSKGRIQKSLDELIRECCHCNHLFMPPVRSFTKIRASNPPVAEQWVTCPGCNRQYSKDLLMGERRFVGTADRAGAHLEYRYEQLTKVLTQKVAGGLIADSISAPEAADVLLRILQAPLKPAGIEAQSGVPGGVDKLIKAKRINNENCAYLWADHIAREKAAGRSLASILKGMLTA
jgi:hypothetical protein